MGAALGVGHVGEAHVGVVEGVENPAGAAEDLAAGGEQGFLGGREDVVAALAGLVQVAAVFPEIRDLGEEARQGFILQGDQLGTLPGHGAAELHQEAEAAALQGLVGGIGGILVGLHGGVEVQPTEPAAGVLHGVQVGQKGLAALTQAALIALQDTGQALAGSQLLLPGLVRGEQILHGPADALVQFVSIGNAVFHDGNLRKINGISLRRTEDDTPSLSGYDIIIPQIPPHLNRGRSKAAPVILHKKRSVFWCMSGGLLFAFCRKSRYNDCIEKALGERVSL